eukprot:458462-Prymnesium_polylepis.2
MGNCGLSMAGLRGHVGVRLHPLVVSGDYFRGTTTTVVRFARLSIGHTACRCAHRSKKALQPHIESARPSRLVRCLQYYTSVLPFRFFVFLGRVSAPEAATHAPAFFHGVTGVAVTVMDGRTDMTDEARRDLTRRAPVPPASCPWISEPQPEPLHCESALTYIGWWNQSVGRIGTGKTLAGHSCWQDNQTQQT